MRENLYQRARDEGRQARLDGLPITANPYPPQLPGANGAWEAGWEDQKQCEAEGYDSHLLDAD